MELNWAPQSRWQRGNPAPADPRAPYSPEPPRAPDYPEAGTGKAIPTAGPDVAPGLDEPGLDEPGLDEPGFDEPGFDEPGPYGAGLDGDGEKAPAATTAPESGHKKVPRRTSVLPWAWLRRVNFRTRISLLVGAAVGIAVALASLVSYIAVSRQLEGQVNSNLQNAIAILTPQTGRPLHLFQTSTGLYEVPTNELLNDDQETGDFIQLITRDSFVDGLPNDKRFFAMSAGAQQALKQNPSAAVPNYETLTATDGNSFRVVSLAYGVQGLVLQIGYQLTNVDNTLAFLRAALILVALGGVALAAGLGWAVGRASIRPVEDLTVAVEHVTATQDLTSTIDDEGNDELARLARSFNAMLAALAASKDQQAQLVSDAGHELRTPLTSLRTNIEVLMRTRDLPSADRQELLADVDGQLKELTTLVGDLVDLAREDERQQPEPELVDFDEIVEHAVERARRRATSLDFDVSLQPGQVYARQALLERAVMNVMDNAAKWSPPGGRVGVSLENNGAWHLTVTDQGPGIAPEDLPHVFERFYRAPTARSMPGSGLGLAIVKRVVTSHGGTIELTSPAHGGTKVEIVLPLDGKSPSTNGHDAAV
jgi:two-component system sensor histidine kinase MprB